MSSLDIASNGWTAFWSTMSEPWVMGMVMFILVLFLLIGFVLRSTYRMVSIAMRVLAALVATVLVLSFANNIGLPIVEWLRTLINMALTAMNAPILL